ncbi:hypothetical protein [Halogeometricum limi]|uniref:DUF7978 domain-containing protein n=1 Tax=Halogeometricum limi TaxID=555875 RepID=A0A1I6HBC6_9EURY|nr:hypothetical protein [Halogeometricum limi]SFR51577.1 hypothetical protein SAMN04488124_1996 [Halogeometricum limi]
MSSEYDARHADTGARSLARLAAALGVAALVVGVAFVALWVAVATDGPFSTLDAVTTMTGGKPAPWPFVPLWTYGGSLGLAVSFVEPTVVVRRNLVTSLDGSADGWWWLGLLAPATLAGAGLLSARRSSWARSARGGLAAGAAVALGYVPLFALFVLVARVGVGDVPPNAEGYVRLGTTGFPPETLDGESVGLRIWRSILASFVAAVGFGGVGGVVASALWNR